MIPSDYYAESCFLAPISKPITSQEIFEGRATAHLRVKDSESRSKLICTESTLETHTYAVGSMSRKALKPWPNYGKHIIVRTYRHIHQLYFCSSALKPAK